MRIPPNPLGGGHVGDQLAAYLDYELSEDERAGVREHLRRCPQCENELATLRATKQLLRDLPLTPAPRSFILSAEQADAAARRVPTRLTAPPIGLRLPRLVLGLRLGATAALVLLFALLSSDVLLTTHGSAQRPPLQTAASSASAPARVGTAAPRPNAGLNGYADQGKIPAAAPTSTTAAAAATNTTAAAVADQAAAPTSAAAMAAATSRTAPAAVAAMAPAATQAAAAATATTSTAAAVPPAPAAPPSSAARVATPGGATGAAAAPTPPPAESAGSAATGGATPPPATPALGAPAPTSAADSIARMTGPLPDQIATETNHAVQDNGSGGPVPAAPPPQMGPAPSAADIARTGTSFLQLQWLPWEIGLGLLAFLLAAASIFAHRDA